MAWQGYAIAAGISFLGGLFGGADYSAVNAHNREVARRNKRIAEANLENTIRTGFRVGLLNMQQGLLKQQFAQAGADARQEGLSAVSANAANAAAAGTIGASVDAVSNEIEMRIGEAEIDLERQWGLQVHNFNTELASLIDQGKASLQGADGQVQYVDHSSSDMWVNALIAGATTAGSMYANKLMTLGLGTPKQSSGLVPNVAGGGLGLKAGGGVGLRF